MKALTAIAATIYLAGTATVQAAQDNTLTAEESAAGWQLLFDGQSFTGWRNYREKQVRKQTRNRHICFKERFFSLIHFWWENTPSFFKKRMVMSSLPSMRRCIGHVTIGT